MEFITKGEFIQALKDYHFIEEKLEYEQSKYDSLHYLRYEKVKSPLDYDIVGYDKNNNAIRKLKGRSHINSEVINDNNEQLDKKIAKCKRKIEQLKNVINKCDTELSNIEEPLRSMLELRYKEHYKLKLLCKKYSYMYFDESSMYKFIMKELNKIYPPQ